jgi:predicted permease
LIAGAVGGAIGAVLLAAAIFLIVKRAQSSQKKTAAAASSSIENYGVLPNITDVAPVSIYDVGNVTLPRESASSAAPH